MWFEERKSFKIIIGAAVLLLFVISLVVITDQLVFQDILNTVTSRSPANLSEARQQMVERQLKLRGINDQRVLEVMGQIERHLFVPGILQGRAYSDRPLPIGHGQTISQPYIVGLMTQSLNLDQDDKVLEIGTGSGYQAAVLAELVKEVYTIEIIQELAESAKLRLQEFGYQNATVKHADGYFGWQEHAPFDAIIVTAAANHTPPPLLAQLKDGGTLVIPLGDTLRFQTLTLVTKRNNDLDTQFITGVRFVPLTREAQR